MVIFPLAPDQNIAQMWSSGARASKTLNRPTGSVQPVGLSDDIRRE